MLKSGPDEHGTGVMFTVAQSFRVLEDLIGDGGDGHRLVHVLRHAQHQSQILLHVTERLLWIKIAFGHF